MWNPPIGQNNSCNNYSSANIIPQRNSGAAVYNLVDHHHQNQQQSHASAAASSAIHTHTRPPFRYAIADDAASMYITPSTQHQPNPITGHIDITTTSSHLHGGIGMGGGQLQQQLQQQQYSWTTNNLTSRMDNGLLSPQATPRHLIMSSSSNSGGGVLVNPNASSTNIIGSNSGGGGGAGPNVDITRIVSSQQHSPINRVLMTRPSGSNNSSGPLGGVVGGIMSSLSNMIVTNSSSSTSAGAGVGIGGRTISPGNMQISHPQQQQHSTTLFTLQFEQIRRECKEQNILFIDTTFPATDTSLFYSCQPPYPIHWLRPADIARQYNMKPEFCIDSYRTCDLKQGELGDCWVVATLASLLVHDYERQNLLPRVVIPNQTFHPSWYSGVFCFRFWRFGRWLDVIIDDLLPTRNGRLVFVHSQHCNEFWGALVEKAYAKLNGSYEALKGGLLCDCLDDYTGGMTESYSLNYDSLNTNAVQPPKNIDDILIKAFDRHSLVGAGINDNKAQGQSGTVGGGGGGSGGVGGGGSSNIGGSARILPSGLVAGHAYTLTDTRKIRLTDDRGERVVTLVRIRNPWGSDVEWNGAWSDSSPEWRSISAQDRTNVGLVKGDGEFWMSLDDFRNNFDTVDICHLPPNVNPMQSSSTPQLWGYYEFFGNWKLGVSAGGRPYFQDTFWTNPQFKINLYNSDPVDKDGMCTCIIGLMQKDKRRLRKQGGLPLLSIGFLIYKLNNSQEVPLMKEFFDRNSWIYSVDFYVNSREIVKRFTLPPGSYVIVPSTYDANQEGEFLLRIFFENSNNKAESTSGKIEMLRSLKKEIDPKLSVRMPHVRRLIMTESGDQMTLDAYQLHRVLNTLLKDDRFYTEITLNACKCLLSLYDKDLTFHLDENDFPQLWNDLFTWMKTFRQYDINNSGHIDSIEFRLLLNDMGIHIPPTMLQKLMYRFGEQDLTISYSNFISVMALIVKSLTTFQQFDVNGRANLSLEDFFSVALLM